MRRIFLLGGVGLLVHCSTTPGAAPKGPDSGLRSGELCDGTNTSALTVHFDPPQVILAPGQSRPVRMIVDPDICTPMKVTFAAENAAIAAAPDATTLDLRHATYDFTVTASAVGTTTLTASMKRESDGTAVDAALAIDVRDGAAPACNKGDAAAKGTLAMGHPVLQGAGALASAALSIPPGAFARTDELALPAFPAEVSCDDDLTAGAAGKPIALSAPVKFVAQAPLSMNQALRREIDFTLPVNPAAFPPNARMRHLQILFKNPLAKTPRAIPVSNPRIEKAGAGYVLKFSSPWIGTYQAAVLPDAGTRKSKRHLTHRGVLGFSMGAIGASNFGLRHHDQFDAVAAMGGPADWTWLGWYLETYALGGFCKAGDPTCAPVAPNLYPIHEPNVHTMDFNHWWYENGNGNGGHFPRSEYIQIFEDLALMMGNTLGENPDPMLSLFPAGPKAGDKWVTGDVTGLPSGVDCRITVDPIKDDPNQDKQSQVQAQCRKSRCDPKNAYIAPTNYFDDEYNPDGSQQVISFCDGGQSGESPYVDTWAPPGADAVPLSFGLAVDLNKNGVRDQNEPVIRAAHEPYDDTGEDRLFDAQEPGYDAVTNPDPNQDDYDFALNPNGTEGNHAYELGEPFKDFGLDGVANTAARHVAGDKGEMDGKYTEAQGVLNFHENDVHRIVHQKTAKTPGGPLTDDALARLDIYTDGGVRDLFNFSVASNHLEGALGGRKRADGSPIKTTSFYSGFDYLPGQIIGQPQNFVPANLLWADIAGAPSLRYGSIDATPQMITQGDGQHVGTAAQLLYRVETGFFFVAKAWTDADRTLTDITRSNPETTTQNELGTDCEANGRCEKIFTGPKTGRTGPIAVTLPPGYALEENRARDVRYPVLFVLHGYGQDPRDLEAVALITNNFMNDGQRSYATRLPKFITVYVDGRCRVDKTGRSECVRGTFWMNSSRADGPQMDSWFDEVIAYVDQNYRTMPPSDVDVTE